MRERASLTAAVERDRDGGGWRAEMEGQDGGWRADGGGWRVVWRTPVGSRARAAETLYIPN